MVINSDAGHTFADRFDYSSPFVAKDDWEHTLRVLATASVLIGVAYTGIENVNSNFVRTRWSDLYLFDLQRLPCTPADCGFALYGLSGALPAIEP